MRLARSRDFARPACLSSRAPAIFCVCFLLPIHLLCPYQISYNHFLSFLALRMRLFFVSSLSYPRKPSLNPFCRLELYIDVVPAYTSLMYSTSSCLLPSSLLGEFSTCDRCFKASHAWNMPPCLRKCHRSCAEAVSSGSSAPCPSPYPTSSSFGRLASQLLLYP